MPFNIERFINKISGYKKGLNIDEDTFKSYLEGMIDQIQSRDEIDFKEINSMICRNAVDYITDFKNEDDSMDFSKLGNTDFQFIAARALLNSLYNRAGKNRSYDPKLKYGSYYGLLSPLGEQGLIEPNIFVKYSRKEIDELGNYIDPNRDLLLTYAGVHGLSNRYLITTGDKSVYELPQERYMTIALSLMINEQNNRLELTKKLYDVLSKQEITMATPIYKNAGRPNAQLSSCFISTPEDDLKSIYDDNTDLAMISKNGGGIGTYVGYLRGHGSSIQGIENTSHGILGWLKQLNNTAVSVDQLGSRAGAIAAYLDLFHIDIEDFLELRLNTGDQAKRAHELFTGVCIPDLFMYQVNKRGDWYLFDPHEVKTKLGYYLQDFYDKEKWDTRHEPNKELNAFTYHYFKAVDSNELKLKKRISAIDLMKKIMKAQLETGMPYMFYRDTVNRENPNKHSGMIYCSNLCVTGDSELLTEDGYKTAKDLYDTQEKMNVVIDTRTTEDEIEGTKIVPTIGMRLTKKKAEIYSVKTKQGFSLKSTKWHKYYVLENDTVLKKSLSELKKGDKLLVQSKEGSFGNNSAVDEAYLMGVIAGDGSFTDKNSPIIYLYGEKETLKEEIEHKISKILEKQNFESIHYSTTLTPKFRDMKDFKQDKKGVLLSNSLLGNVFNKNYSFNKDTKLQVPKYIKNGNKATQSAYLSGLFQMDGCIHVNEKYKSGSIELVSINQDFVKSIQILLLNFGIYSTIYKRNPRVAKLSNGYGKNKEYNCSATYRITIQDRNSRKLFMENIEMKSSDIKKYNDFEETLQPISRKPKHKFTAEIKSIDFYGIEDVYDTTQPDYHSLIFNGIVTGNCSEISQTQNPTTVIDEIMTNDGKIITTKESGDFVVCNLSSTVLNNAFKINYNSTKEEIEKSKKYLEDVLRIQVRATDNTIDINNLPVKQAEFTNQKYRAIGLGEQGIAALLAKMNIPFDSDEATEFIGDLEEIIMKTILDESANLAQEKGSYKLFEGSEWESGAWLGRRGITEGELLEKTKKGMRNAWVRAVAPTASTAVLAGSTAAADTIFDTIFYDGKKDAKMPIVAPELSPETWFFYKPTGLMEYEEETNLGHMWAIKHNQVRQVWVDQATSFNLYILDDIKASQLLRLHNEIWSRGIKTSYYTRSQDASQMDTCIACSA